MANERNDNIKKGVHGCSREDKYIAPTDPLIKERLEWFQDQKLALMMHFGPYAQMGVNVSWPLSAADDWARCDMDWEEDLETFREQYVNLNKSFNPMRLQPKKVGGICQGKRIQISHLYHKAPRRLLHVRHQIYRLQGHKPRLPFPHP